MKTTILLCAAMVIRGVAFGDELAAAREKLEKQIAEMPVVAHLNQPYAGTDNPKQRLDLFLPKERAAGQALPVVVFIHGGAWKHGDRVYAARYVLDYASGGAYAGVTVSYRLTDEAKWPAQIYDCKAAIRWIRGRAAEFRLDPDRIGVWGSSAGGHLVSLLGTGGGVKDLEGGLGEFTAHGSRVACVVNVWGPQDFTMPLMVENGEPVTEDPAVADLLGGPLAEKRAEVLAASPVTYVSGDDPPFLTLHGTDDRRVDFKHAERIHVALTAAGVPSLLIPIAGGGHGVRHPQMPDRIRAFLDRHLRGMDVEIPAGPLEPQPASP